MKYQFLTLPQYSQQCRFEMEWLRDDIGFWDLWIGKGDFDTQYLHQVFQDRDNEILLLFISPELQKRQGTTIITDLAGVVAHSHFCLDGENYCVILLMAKRYGLPIKRVGYSLIQELGRRLLQTHDTVTFLCVDDSQIPDYYGKLGFTLTTDEKYQQLLDYPEKKIYYRNF